MAWFKVDDSFGTSPKVMTIPRRIRMQCLGLWVTAGTWSAQHLTDGRIPDHMIEEWGAEVSHGDALVASGLWERDTEYYVFHDWSDYQPTRTDTLANREKERRRKEDWRNKNREKTGESPAGTDSRGDNPSEYPDPTRPDPTNIKNKPVTEADFDKAYSHWPKKTERARSFEKFKKVAAERGLDVITADIIRFGDAYGKSSEKQFVPALVTWLNGKRWTDELPGGDKPKHDGYYVERPPAPEGKRYAVDVANGVNW